MTKHLARCGQCDGCMAPPCMNCKYCDDLYSGKPKKLKQICINRRCIVVMQQQKDRNVERRQHQVKRSSGSEESPPKMSDSSGLEPSSPQKLCGNCTSCLQPDCGNCYYCIDQRLYGGRHFSDDHCQEKVCEKVTNSSLLSVANLEAESPETDAPSTSASYCPTGHKSTVDSPAVKKELSVISTPLLNGSYSKRKRVSFELNRSIDSDEPRIRRQKRLAKDRIRRAQEKKAELERDELDSDEEETEDSRTAESAKPSSTGPSSLEKLFSLAKLPRTRRQSVQLDQLPKEVSTVDLMDLKWTNNEDNWDDMRLLESSSNRPSHLFPSSVASYVGSANEPCGLLLSYDASDIERLIGSSLSSEQQSSLPNGVPSLSAGDQQQVPPVDPQLNSSKLVVAEAAGSSSPIFRVVKVPLVQKSSTSSINGPSVRPLLDQLRSPGKTITIDPHSFRVCRPNGPNMGKPIGTHVTFCTRPGVPSLNGNHLDRVLVMNNLPNGTQQALGRRLIPVGTVGQPMGLSPTVTTSSSNTALSVAKAIVNGGSFQPSSTVMLTNRIVVPSQKILSTLNAGRPATTANVAVSNNNNSTPISVVFCGANEATTVVPSAPPQKSL